LLYIFTLQKEDDNACADTDSCAPKETIRNEETFVQKVANQSVIDTVVDESNKKSVENTTNTSEIAVIAVSEAEVLNIGNTAVATSQSLSNPIMETTVLVEEPVAANQHNIGATQELFASPDITTSEIISSKESKYAGGLLLTPFLQKIDPVGLLEEAQHICKQNALKEADKQLSNPVETINCEMGNHPGGYTLSNWLLTIIYLLWFGFRSIEDFKFAISSEFGLLLGKDHAPCTKTIRTHFKSIVDPKVTEEWMMQLIRRYVTLDIIELGTLYFDGHKIPYYGQIDLPKGYISSRRFPMKVLEQVFANDRSGRPIFLRVHDMSSTFKDNVRGMINDALGIFKESGKKAPLVVAFDRELYDSEFLSELDKLGVLYITWRKNDTKVSREQLQNTVYSTVSETREESNEKVLKYIFYRREIHINKYRTEAISFLKAELLKDSDRLPSTLVTNAARFTEEDYPDFIGLSTGDIIDTLCDRWHQENYFREAKHKARLDYIPGYEAEERREELNLKNPEIKKLKNELSNIGKQLGKINAKINKKLMDANEKEKPMEKVLELKSIQKLLQEQRVLEAQVQEIKDTKDKLPEEVSAKKLGYDSLELVLDRKVFLDTLRIVMNNSHQMLLEVFKKCYHDPRDLHATLYAITKQGGIVEEYSDRVVVKLDMLDKGVYQTATKKLCAELNKTQTVFKENGKLLVFDVY